MILYKIGLIQEEQHLDIKNNGRLHNTNMDKKLKDFTIWLLIWLFLFSIIGGTNYVFEHYKKQKIENVNNR